MVSVSKMNVCKLRDLGGEGLQDSFQVYICSDMEHVEERNSRIFKNQSDPNKYHDIELFFPLLYAVLSSFRPFFFFWNGHEPVMQHWEKGSTIIPLYFWEPYCTGTVMRYPLLAIPADINRYAI